MNIAIKEYDPEDILHFFNNSLYYVISNNTDDKFYSVDIDIYNCNCVDFKNTGNVCKHIFKSLYYVYNKHKSEISYKLKDK